MINFENKLAPQRYPQHQSLPAGLGGSASKQLTRLNTKFVRHATTGKPVLRTLDLRQAAVFLRLHPQTVRKLAIAGEIPATKPGKRWVFVEQNLADWLRFRYRATGQVSQGDMQEKALCRSTDDQIQTTGGAASRHRTARRYADLLGLKTSAKPTSTKTD